MDEIKEKPVIKLIGENRNAFFILHKVIDALRKAGANREYINEYLTKAQSGDYNNLLAVTMDYCDVI